MSKAELNENRAIVEVTSREESTGYRKAVDANIPVTYLDKSTVVCVHNGQRIEVEHLSPSQNWTTPKTYVIK